MIVFCFVGPLLYRPDLTHVDLSLSNLPPSERHLLGTDSPEALAARLVSGTPLADPKVRAALWRRVVGLP